MEIPNSPSSPPERREVPDFVLARDGVATRQPDKQEFKALRHVIVGTIFYKSGRKDGGILPVSLRAKGFKLSEYMWIAILDDLLDPKILRNTYKSRGHLSGDTRIARTRDYFLKSLLEFRLDDVVDMVNLMHEINGVVKPDAEGVAVDPYYEEAFCYVLSSLIDRMRDYYEHELHIPRMRGGKPNPEFQRISSALCDLWYGVARQMGLRRRPATVEDHDRFVAAHEARSHREMEEDPGLQDKASEMAANFLPKIAKLANTSQAEVVETIRRLRPDLAAMLRLDARAWSASNEREDAGRWATVKGITSTVLGKIKTLIAGKPEGEKTIDALRTVALGPGADRSVRAVFHFARARKDFELRRSTVRLGPGEPLIAQGGEPDFLYVMLRSSAPLEVVRTEGGRETTLRMLPPDEATVLGEIAMFRGAASSTVRAPAAGADVDVVKIPRAQFLSMLQQDEGLWLKRTLVPKMQARLRHIEIALRQAGMQNDPAFLSILNDMHAIATQSGPIDPQKMKAAVSALQDRIIAYMQDTPDLPEAVAHHCVAVLWDLRLSAKFGNGPDAAPAASQ